MLVGAILRVREQPRWRRSIIAFAVLVVIPLLLLHLITGGRFLRPFPGTSSNEANDDFDKFRSYGLVTIATAGYDATYLVDSARKAGQWQGRIFVISDGISVAPQECAVIRVKPPADSLYAVAFKTQLLDLVSHEQYPGIKRLIYLDCDMIVNAPISNFLRAFGEWDERSGCDIYMVRERWYTKSDWNSGTILIDRETSALMLKKWEVMIQENHDIILAQNKYSKDQWALMQLTDNYNVCALPGGHITFVADFWSKNVAPFFTKLGLTKPATFMHYTSAKNEKSAPHFKTKISAEELQRTAAEYSTSRQNLLRS